MVLLGEKGGAIRLIEMKLSRPVHHFNCPFHANELPLRHLVENLDGKTFGPRGFTGPIGKQLQNCRNNPIVKLERIHVEIPTVDYKDVSTDQKCLFEIHQAISQGFCLSHSLWVTTGNRLLRLYISTEHPSKNLLIIVHYNIIVYVPMWFSFKL